MDKYLILFWKSYKGVEKFIKAEGEKGALNKADEIYAQHKQTILIVEDKGNFTTLHKQGYTDQCDDLGNLICKQAAYQYGSL